MKLETKILAAFGAGIAVGAVSRLDSLGLLRSGVIALEPIGSVFIRLITMVVVPLVIASVFVGVASLGNVRSLGRIGGKTLAYFVSTTALAAIIGLLVASVARVGATLPQADRNALLGATIAAVTTTPPTFVQTLVGMIPQNPIASAASGDLLPLIIAVCIFAAAATVATGRARDSVVRFFSGVNELSAIVIGWLMRLAPTGVFVLIAVTVARSGMALLTQLATFTVVVVLALVAHVLLVLFPVLRAGARMPIRHFFSSVSDALLLAFSTASSNAALPVSMAAARDRLAIPGEIVGFVLPAGASLNKNGAAAYKAVAAVFLAHIYGLPLTPGMMLTIASTATLAAFAGTGVPGSSLITTMIVLNAIGLGPRAAAGIALIAAVDRPLDMCRTAVNTIGNLVGAAWIARTERDATIARPSLPDLTQPRQRVFTR